MTLKLVEIIGEKELDELNSRSLNFIVEIINRTKLISLRTIMIGEGQTLGVATYENENDFNDTNKWLGPLLKNAAQELDGKFESLAGEVVISYDKPVIEDQ